MEPFTPPTLDSLRSLLEQVRSIAVVGLSDKATRPSHRVAAYLQEAGYRILPVNPAIQEALGEQAWPSVAALPEKVDVVCIFRRSEEVGPIVEEAIALGVRVVWMQDGVVNPQAAARASAAGLEVVMNDCMLRRHLALGLPPIA